MPDKALTLSSLALALVVAGFAAPTTAHAQAARMRFESMDQNRDNIISRSEWRGSDRSFEVHDWNRDGQLSGPEVRPGAQRNTSWEQADHAPNRFERYVSWTTTGFNNLDHNRDRRITSDEWHFDRETFRRVDRNRDGALDQSEFLGTSWDDDRGDNFDDLDVNNNGRVERSEWHAGNDVFNALDQNRDGVLSRFEVVGGQDASVDTWDQFAALDYDRNGSIGRNEWHWSLGSFNQRDLNRDGVLSRREFEVTGGRDGATGTSGGSRLVRVNAQQRWTDSGITVRAGDTLTIDASGTIQMSDNAQDTATVAGSSSGRRAPDAPVLNQPAGGLIARIDDYGPIFLGGRRSFTAPVTGRLYFGVNDDHLGDNKGEFAVTVAR
jgi:Ca2+-binding EF-hand superfamily protein